MPQMIFTIDQIMARERRDMLFIEFMDFGDDRRTPWRARHFRWFRRHGLQYEPAAPRGWMEGTPPFFAVYFSSLDDPRIAEYSAEFEDSDGMSREPDSYRMGIMIYDEWQKEQASRPKDNPGDW